MGYLDRINRGLPVSGPQATLLRSNSALVQTSRGSILIGCPPEIVKSLLVKKMPIPKYVVLTDRFISGVQIAVEPEFPFYASMFMGKARPTFIGSREAIGRLKVILQESLLGPEKLPEHLQKIRDHFALKGPDGRPLSIDELVNFRTFENSRVRLESGIVVHKRRGTYRVLENNVLLGEVNASLFTDTLEPLAPKGRIEIPGFGVSFIGTGSGFVPGKKTTSFVLWTDQGGIFVDPLDHPNECLINCGIAPTDIKYILQTHAHADHDSGLITKVLNGHRVVLITSKLIYESELRKLQAITGRDMRDYITLIPAEPGEVLTIGDTRLKIGSALHSIPTINFVAEQSGKKIAYSADTLFDPPTIEKLKGEGTITPEHAEELLHFGEGADLLIHETGMPPLHTPWKNIEPKAAAAGKVVIVHTGPIEGLPAGLEVAQEGSTIALLPRSPESGASTIGRLKKHFLFAELPDRVLDQLAGTIQLMPFNAGEDIVRKGDLGDEMYLVEQGMVQVVDNGKVLATLMPGDLFGEIALFLNVPRTASVVGLTEGKLIPIGRAQFDAYLSPEKIRTRLERIIHNRPLVSQLSIARSMSAATIAKLAAHFVPAVFTEGAKIIQEGTKGRNFIVLVNGTARVSIGGKEIATLGPSSTIGEISLLQGSATIADVTVTSPMASVLMMSAEDFERFCQEIPQLRFLLTQVGEERRDESFAQITHLSQGSHPTRSPLGQVGDLAATIGNVVAGKLGPLEVLHAAELWLNGFKSSFSDPRIAGVSAPGSRATAFSLRSGLFPQETVEALDRAALPDWLRSFILDGNGARLFVHPNHYLYLPRELKDLFPEEHRAIPSSSLRTMFLPGVPLAVKTHFPYYKGPFERRLSPASAEHSHRFSRLLREAAERPDLPEAFAYFPEYGTYKKPDPSFPAGFGNVYRELTPHPVIAGDALIYPFFALYSHDIRSLDPGRPPLIVQMIENGRGPQQDGIEYFSEAIWRKIVGVWAHFAFDLGAVLEPHGQNLLAEISFSGELRRVIFRDFQSCMVDVDQLKRRGLFAGFEKHHLGVETPAEVSYSLVFDHYLGFYMMDPMVEVLSRHYGADRISIIKRLRDIAREILGDNLEKFPKGAVRHRRGVSTFPGNVLDYEFEAPNYR